MSEVFCMECGYHVLEALSQKISAQNLPSGIVLGDDYYCNHAGDTMVPLDTVSGHCFPNEVNFFTAKIR